MSGQNQLPVTFTKHFSLDSKKFNRHGVFNPALNIDTKLFIDPLLLKLSKNETIKNQSCKNFVSYFEDTIDLIKEITTEDDVVWSAVDRMLTFPEVKGTCLGYGSKNIDGHSFGPEKRFRLMKNAMRAVEIGVNNPHLFELLTVLEADVGPDLISDMVTNIIYKDLCEITRAVVDDLGGKIPLKAFMVKECEYYLPANPFNPSTPVILVPKDILRDLPLVNHHNSRQDAAAFNSQLRARVSKEIGEIWKARSTKEKDEILDSILKNKEHFETLLAYIASLQGKPYNLLKDKRGEVLWHDIDYLLKRFEVKKIDFDHDSTDTLVRNLIEKFKSFIENNRGWDLLWDSDGPRHEQCVQRIFHAFSLLYCNDKGIDISPESNAGSGPVDFKLSLDNCKVIVEYKLSTNTAYKKGLTKQLNQYIKAEGASHSYYVLVQLEDDKKFAEKMIALDALLEEMKSNNEPNIPQIIYINGNKKKSASKM